MSPGTVTVTDTERRVVCERCTLADRAPARLRGLLGRSELPAGDGLLLRPAASIHTWCMRFPIDVVFVDGDFRVLAVRRALGPWRMAGCRGARAVLELAAGEAGRRGIRAGTRLMLEEPSDHRVEAPSRRRRLRPAVLALAAIVAAAAPLRLGLTPYGVMAAGALAVLVVLSAFDLQARILPNGILLPAMGGVLAGQLAFHPERLGEALVAGFVAGAVLLAPRLVDPAAIGMGDVKLAVFLGLLLGRGVLPAMMLGFVATVPVLAVLLVQRGRAARGTALPLGPFLALGAAIVLLA